MFRSNGRAPHPTRARFVKKGQNALMIKKLSAPKFYQQTYTFFLNPSSAKTFAYKLASSSNLSIVGADILDIVIGNITNSHIGAYFTIANMLRNLYLNSVIDAILSYANKGKSVEVRIIK